MHTFHKMQILSVIFAFIFCHGILADNSCIFEHPTKGVINLTSIGFQNGRPRFRDLSPTSSSSYIYSFNPCYSFMENTCQDAAVCQISKDRQYSFKLAMQNVSTWTVESNTIPVLTYQYGSQTVSITMSCSSTVQDQFEVLREDSMNHFSMRLRSRCACWNGCGTPKSSTTAPKTTTPAIYSSACRYWDSRRGTIDLSSIGDVTGKPAFKDVSAINPNNYVWSYNPCYKFSEDTCQNVAGCQIDKARHVSYPIGLQEYVSWINMNTTSNLVPSIVYSLSSSNPRLTVQLICDRSTSNHRLQVVGETALGEYLMQLSSPCACWDGCLKPSPHPDPLIWNSWMIAGIAGAISVTLLFIMMLTCLFCSKPKRRYPTVWINEKTPFMKGAKNYRS